MWNGGNANSKIQSSVRPCSTVANHGHVQMFSFYQESCCSPSRKWGKYKRLVQFLLQKTCLILVKKELPHSARRILPARELVGPFRATPLTLEPRQVQQWKDVLCTFLSSWATEEVENHSSLTPSGLGRSQRAGECSLHKPQTGDIQSGEQVGSIDFLLPARNQKGRRGIATQCSLLIPQTRASELTDGMPSLNRYMLLGGEISSISSCTWPLWHIQMVRLPHSQLHALGASLNGHAPGDWGSPPAVLVEDTESDSREPFPRVRPTST